MERLSSQLQCVSILLFTIIVLVSGDNITNEERELLSQGKVLLTKDSEENDIHQLYTRGNNVENGLQLIKFASLLAKNQLRKRSTSYTRREDCYNDNGFSYRGDVAVTERGDRCLSWSSSNRINERTHPGKGLGNHNFCRNPDGDTKPWCWISHVNRKFGFCKVSKCPEVATTSENSHAAITVKLVGGRDASEGNVEVVINNVKYRVCDDNWDNKDATVVCRTLGYRGGGVATKKSHYGPDLNDIVLDEVNCDGTETEFNQCQGIVGVTKHDCDSSELAGAICNKAPVAPTTNHQKPPICGKRPFDQMLSEHPSIREKKSITVIRPSMRTDSLPWNSRLSHVHDLKIAGGEVVQYGAHPWQVRVHYKHSRLSYDNFDSNHCGATIISEFWILSAAHCFIRRHRNAFIIIVGDHSLMRTDPGEQTFETEDIILHEHYNYDTKDNDIALIKIKPTRDGRGIKFNDYVQPVCLPDARTPLPDDTKCWVSGWGEESYSVYPDSLRAAEVPIINQGLCKSLYSRGWNLHISSRMVCAGHIAGGPDSCTGDSGGPLVCNIADTYTILGITSWGQGCAMPNVPGVYTRVSSFVSWIDQTIKSHGNNNAGRHLHAGLK